MAGTLYFVDNCPLAACPRAADLPAAVAARLVPVLGAASLECKRSPGPGGARGLLIAPIPADKDGEQADCEFFHARQTWHWLPAIADSEFRVAVGFETARKPRPEDLLRPSPVVGKAVELADGNAWTFPVVGPRDTTLPHSFRRVDSGAFAATVRPAFEQLFADSETWFELLRSGGGFTYATYFDFAARALAVNYRVGLDECSADVLDLIGVEHFDAVLRACLGLLDRDQERARKKKDSAPAAAGCSSPNGQGD